MLAILSVFAIERRLVTETELGNVLTNVCRVRIGLPMTGGTKLLASLVKFDMNYKGDNVVMETKYSIGTMKWLSITVMAASLCVAALAGSPAMAQSYSYDDAQSGSSFTVTHQILPDTSIKVIDIDPISSASNQVGDTVRMRVAPDDTSGVPKSVIFVGRIRRVDAANNHVGGDIGIRFDTIATVGAWQALAPPVTDGPAVATVHFVGQGGATGGKDDVAIGAGVGALLGASRKRKLGDTVEGGIIGALGGLFVQKATTHSGSDINLKPGDETTIILRQPITLKTELIAS
jgi:hypothetical protein